MAAIRWTRSVRNTGETRYTSRDGRFVIDQHRWGARTWYTLMVDGEPAPERWMRESDELVAAKGAANLIIDPSYEP